MSAPCEPGPATAKPYDPAEYFTREPDPRAIFAPLAIARAAVIEERGAKGKGALSADSATNRTAYRKVGEAELRAIARSFGVPLDALRERVAPHAEPLRWLAEMAALFLRDDLGISPAAQQRAHLAAGGTGSCAAKERLDWHMWRRHANARWLLRYGMPDLAVRLGIITASEAADVLRRSGRLPPQKPAYRPGPGDGWPTLRGVLEGIGDNG